MQKEDWKQIAKMVGYVYIPIVLLIIFVFLMVQYQARRIDDKRVYIENATRNADSQI